MQTGLRMAPTDHGLGDFPLSQSWCSWYWDTDPMLLPEILPLVKWSSQWAHHWELSVDTPRYVPGWPYGSYRKGLMPGAYHGFSQTCPWQI